MRWKRNPTYPDNRTQPRSSHRHIDWGPVSMCGTKRRGRLCERTDAFSRWAPLTPDFVHSVHSLLFYSIPPRLRASLRRPTSILAAKSLSRSVPDGELRRLLLLFPFLVFKILIHFSWDSDFSLSPSCLLLWFVNFVMVIDELSTLHKGF